MSKRDLLQTYLTHIHARDNNGKLTHDFIRCVEIVEKIKEICSKIIV